MPNKTAPIFVVGAPRSGTTLLAAMIGSHSRIACGPETQFFSHLHPAALARAASDPQWPGKAVDLLLSLSLHGQAIHVLFGITEGDIRRYLKAREPSVAAMLESLTAQFAAREGKPRWSEKTPNHLLHLQQIRALYPEAPIVRIMRDPRAAAISMCKLPWASRRAIVNCFLWNDWFERSEPFFERDARSMTVVYGDLIDRPEASLQAVCDFVSEPFEPGMLHPAKAGAKLISDAEPWKAQVVGALDGSKVNAWKSAYSEQELIAATVLCDRGIRRFGYDTGGVRVVGEQYIWGLTGRDLENNYEVLLGRASRGWRLVPTRDRSLRQPVVFLPAGSITFAKDLRNTLALAWTLARRRWAGVTNLYWPEPLARRSPGRAIEAMTLRALARPDREDSP